MRVRMRRRSVSSFVSPGPRVPMPPPRRDSAAPEPTSRGSRYLQLRQLHLQLAFARPRAPREDVEDELRAVEDLPPDRSSRSARSWAGVSSLSKTTRSTPVSAARGGERRHLARRRGTSTGRGCGRSCRTRSTTSPPAASASPASSSSDRSASSRRARPADQADEGRALAARYRPATHASISSQATAPARTSRTRGSVTSTMVDGGAARRRAGVEQQVDALADRARHLVGVGRGGLAAAVGAGGGDGAVPRRRTAARATAWAGTRTPTRPVPALIAGASESGARQEQGQRTGPEPRGQPRGEGRQRAQAPLDLREIGGDQRKRLLGRPPLRGEEARDGRGIERVGREAVERVGGNRDDPAARNHGGGLLHRGGDLRGGGGDTNHHRAAGLRSESARPCGARRGCCR